MTFFKQDSTQITLDLEKLVTFLNRVSPPPAICKCSWKIWGNGQDKYLSWGTTETSKLMYLNPSADYSEISRLEAMSDQIDNYSQEETELGKAHNLYALRKYYCTKSGRSFVYESQDLKKLDNIRNSYEQDEKSMEITSEGSTLS